MIASIKCDTRNKVGYWYGEPLVKWGPGPKNYKVRQSPDEWCGYRDLRGNWWIPRNGLHSDQGTIPKIAQLIGLVADDQCWSFLPHDDAFEFGNRLVYPIGENGLPDLSKQPSTVPVTLHEANALLAEAMYSEQIWFNTVNRFQRGEINLFVGIISPFIWKHGDTSCTSGCL